MADGSISSSPRDLQQKSASSWIRWILPSATDLIFVGILAALVFTPLATKLLGDAGIGWHIRTGEQILATHSIPRTDYFSSTMVGRPWFAWEWLYDVGVGVLNRIAGLNGIAWFTAVVIAGVFSWMFRLLVRREMNFIFALLLVLLSMSASTIHFLARPHVLSWLFTLAFFWLLDSTERNYFKGVGRHRKLWALPMLMLIWVNVHGGFVLGFVLIVVFWFGSVWTWFRTKGTGIEDLLHKIAAGRRVRDLTRVGLASLVVSLANPYGWKLHAHIYSYLTDRFLMDHIEEFQSPNFHGLAEKSFLILLVVSLAVLVTSGRKLRTSEGLLVLFITYAGLYASRNIPVSSILLAMIVGPWLPDPKPLRNFSLRMSATELALKAHLWPIVAVIATFLIAANRGWVGSHSLMDAHFDAHRMPVQAVNYLDARDLQGSILTPDYWGGYIIYRLYPKVHVVVDDRHDLYGAEFLKSYLRMMHVERGWDEFLRDHTARSLLLPRNSPLATILANNPEWRSVYADDMAIVFMNSSEKFSSTRAGNVETPASAKGITKGN
jgi:hypothetical protein